MNVTKETNLSEETNERKGGLQGSNGLGVNPEISGKAFCQELGVCLVLMSIAASG